MTYDPREKLDHVGTNPNKGLNTRTYMMALIAALLVLLVVAVFLAGKGSTKATPGKDPSPPSSSPAAKTPGH